MGESQKSVRGLKTHFCMGNTQLIATADCRLEYVFFRVLMVYSENDDDGKKIR